MKREATIYPPLGDTKLVSFHLISTIILPMVVKKKYYFIAIGILSFGTCWILSLIFKNMHLHGIAIRPTEHSHKMFRTYHGFAMNPHLKIPYTATRLEAWRSERLRHGQEKWSLKGSKLSKHSMADGLS